jgi:hypothetical protein
MNHLFITGAGRSGTSFLMKVMTRSPEVHVATEIHFFSALFHDGLWKNFRRAAGRRRAAVAWSPERLAGFLNSGRHFGIFWDKADPFTPAEVADGLGGAPVGPKALYAFLLRRDQRRNAPGKWVRYIGEKTPLNIFHSSRLFQWFPEARILYIYRNPVDVLRSEVNKDEKPDYPVDRRHPVYAWGLIGFVFLEWGLAGILALWQRRRRPGRFLVISYEALTARPAEVTRAVADRLGIGFSEEMVRVRRFASSYAGKRRSEAWRPPRWVEAAYHFFLGPIRRKLDQVRVEPREAK